ncbi:MAG: nucleoside-diphosphate sugar epimerase/dehydratase [Clostridia bacterium]|nr:nucleoside-diphosphate sugar epimerase/dehydratase [Clostridia bacterium]
MKMSKRFGSLMLRRCVLLAWDLLSVFIAYTVATLIVPASPLSWHDGLSFYSYVGSAIVLSLFILHFFHAYSSLWEYAELPETGFLMSGLLLSTIICFVFHRSLGLYVPLPGYAVGWTIEILLIGSSRIIYRVLRGYLRRSKSSIMHRVLIVGAGDAATMAISAMKDTAHDVYVPVVMVDDNPEKMHCFIHGVQVVGTTQDIPKLVKEYEIDMILLAIPSVSETKRKEIAEIALSTGKRMQTLPSMQSILFEGISVSTFQDIDITTFLNRDEITLDSSEIKESLEGKTVLVTGAGGSIGSELCRQLARFSLQKLVLFDIIENDAYTLQNELRRMYPKLATKLLIGSVRDEVRLNEVFSCVKPDIVFHAAAHKHVPIMEDCPGEAVKNNIFGTLNVAFCADRHNVSRFVLISTDKAVNPTNVMGATKRTAEMIIQYLSKRSKTCFSLVRFGNVLGSNGSVIPYFKKQIAYGGPVTVTHPEITRFFMTIPEAAQLVIQSGTLAKGGEIFILDMGEPVKIVDLAEKMIRLAGFEPGKEIKIVYTGLRPGEKLYEELLLKEEGITATKYKKIYTVPPTEIEEDFLDRVYALRAYVDKDDAKLIAGIESLIGKKLQPIT